MSFTLYSYFRSSAAYRVRIALNLKEVEYRQEPVNLVRGDQNSSGYRGINAQGLVPALAVPSGDVLAQSPAILEWLEERFPQPPLYPPDPEQRARIRSLCHSVACDIHPLNNLRVLRYLTEELGVDEAQRQAWYQHWIESGFAALEPQIVGPYAAGETVTMADLYLVPQVYNARRFETDLTRFPTITNVFEHCQAHPAFATAHPDRQPDSPTK